jgi:CRISPR-associated protein Csm2
MLFTINGKEEDMISFYLDAKNKTIDPHLFSEKAEALAKQIYESGLGRPDREGKRKLIKNMRTQIRKFYDETLKYSMRANSGANPEPWDIVHPYINMLIAKAAYAEGRDKVSNNFTEFIRSSISQIHEPPDLLIFSNFFEAFMGFYRQYDK